MDEKVTIVISRRLADELSEWVSDEKDQWPENTAFQADLNDLARQLARLKSHYCPNC